MYFCKMLFPLQSEDVQQFTEIIYHIVRIAEVFFLPLPYVTAHVFVPALRPISMSNVVSPTTSASSARPPVASSILYTISGAGLASVTSHADTMYEIYGSSPISCTNATSVSRPLLLAMVSVNPRSCIFFRVSTTFGNKGTAPGTLFMSNSPA